MTYQCTSEELSQYLSPRFDDANRAAATAYTSNGIDKIDVCLCVFLQYCRVLTIL